MDEEIEPFYQMRAKEFVDMLFDKGYFRDDVSRDGMKDVEDLLAYFFKSYTDSSVKCALMVKKLKG